ncbi:ImpA family type VI secretion system protein [Psychromonas ossibalaenae]|uniref:type VI secretion system protein TssA n=1 Tax=Psychromonas ossibalaenae TaxID=444922 RepID=UPI00036DAA80|nr:type VI secretion system ImpA family N-terminal domain-containing protein [Psychromonas ossibalaenae]
MIFTESQRQTLLSPLAENNFCGVYLKSERQSFRPLRNEFNLAQTSLRKLNQNPEADELDAILEDNKNNWNVLSGSLTDVFANSSRDIELGGWMMAAQVVIDPSLSGALQTSLWLEELVGSHWDSLQPILPANKIKSTDESEIQSEINSFKVKAFVQLLGESEDSGLLYSPLLMTPLIADLDFSRYQSEEHKGTLADIRSRYRAAALADRASVVELIDNLDKLKNSIGAIEKQVIAVCQQYLLSPPGFKFVISIIDKMLRAVEFISGLKPASVAPLINTPVQDVPDSAEKVENSAENICNVENAAMENPQSTPAGTSFASLAQQQEFNRDQAFQQLREIADYFRQTEPHSPVAYLLDKSIRWGYMPLPELMTELLSNQQDTIDRVFNLTGLDEQGQTALPNDNNNIGAARVLPAQARQLPADNKPVFAVPETEKTDNQAPPDTQQKSSSESLW